ncbi:MAG: MerR family transcriptional regulator, partial [Acidobacteria bacterium]|nr:MerR family transcriptional regulator [Acidobacteriota bacterium]
TEGNTRLYSDSDLERLSLILNLTREMRVNLAGVEIVLNMREKMARMQAEIERFVRLLGREMDKIRGAGSGGGVRTSLVRVSGRSEEPVQRGKDGKTTSKP